MFQPLMTSVKCCMLFPLKSTFDAKTFVEVMLKLHCKVFVNLVIRLFCNSTNIGLCWARMKGHGSNSVIKLLERSMVDSDDRFADSTKTRGSMDVMTLLIKFSVFS